MATQEIAITPAPTDAEAAAIAAAVTIMWPQPVVAESAEPARSLAWRFSGRWWRRDRAAVSQRPWS